MRKRRVLALLLALSLVVSGNGMTVLAAEQGADMPVLMSQEETLPEGDNLAEASDAEMSADDDKTETTVSGDVNSEKDEASEEEKDAAAEETSGNTEETEAAAPKEDNAGQGENGTSAEEGVNGTPVSEAKPAEDEKPEEGEQTVPTETDGTEGLPDGVEEDDAQDQETDTDTPEYISENHAEIPAAVSEEALLETQPYVSRIMTFTDDTGMQITYDANASTQYQYVVDKNGVLTAVNTGKVDENGDPIPVEFSGNVELKQPDEGTQYTSIASGVFSQNTEITYVKLPAGVETIGKEAFKGCTELKGVYLPAGLKKIEDSAFEGCTRLSQIAMPKTVTQIGDSAFKGDTRLHLIYMKDMDFCDLKSIGDHAFEGCSVLAEFCSDTEFLLPSKLESIGEAAFKGCKAIKKVDLTNTKVAVMGVSAFQDCSGLTELSPGKFLPLIPEHAFDGCRALTAINFVNGDVDMTIDRWAFANCYNLKQLVLPQTVVEVKDYAFQGCTKLTRVEINCFRIKLEDKAFPVGEATGMVIVAEKGSKGYYYAEEHFLGPDADKFYQYIVEDVNGSIKDGGKLPGGKVWVCASDQTEYDKNINTLNKGKGVQSGSEKYYVWHQAEEGYTFNWAALRCNGQPMPKEEGKPYFTMPEGGVVITAEFLANTPANIKGQKVTVEFSAGEPLQNGEMDDYGYFGVELKVGQTTRMFLLNEDGETIPATQISEITSKPETVATVTKNGVITAVGTGNGEQADATVKVVVKGGDGRDITINRTISVATADAKTIILKASGKEDFFKVDISEGADGLQTAGIKKNYVAKEPLSFTLKANVYDDTDSISKKLTWTTSNDKVAVLEKPTTEGQDPVNEVKVIKGCEGEATITVTAKNAAGAEKDEVTQKFVIRVYEDGFKLNTSSLVLNPNITDGGVIELIAAYSKNLEGAEIKLYQEEGNGALGTTPFYVVEDKEAGGTKCKRFRILPRARTIDPGSYPIKVCVKNDKEKLLDLEIIVKRSIPTPTIKFNTTKVKYNLFYKDGRATVDGACPVVNAEITRLGMAKIEKVALEALTDKLDDKLFVQNFVVDEAKSDYEKGKVVIKRREDENGDIGNLLYTSQKKPAVTGNLVIYYKGYEKSAAKKMKVTIPTCTTAPSYALREVKGTYCQASVPQDETFELYDKKSKTKEQVKLNMDQNLGYTVAVDQDRPGIYPKNDPVIQEGSIVIKEFDPVPGKLMLALKNESWDLDKDGKERILSFAYTVNVSNAAPTISTNPKTVTLNLNYSDEPVKFKLASNQKGVIFRSPAGLTDETKIGELEKELSQAFEPVGNTSNVAEAKKLGVGYTKDNGWEVFVKDSTVKKGTYKFECAFPQGVLVDYYAPLKKVTLTVKVTDNKPVIKFGKGSLQLNKRAYEDNDDRETVKISFKADARSEGYTLAPTKPDAGCRCITEISCTSYPITESHFDFSVSEGNQNENIDDTLSVALHDNRLGAGTYTFEMTAKYHKKEEGKPEKIVSAKPVKFKVKVSDAEISLTVSSKGQINLVNREGEASDKNGIIYTPKLKNINGEITDVKIYDAGSRDKESKYFDIELIKEGKDAGKFFVTPKVTLKAADTPEPPETPENPSVSDNTTTPEKPSISDNTTTPEKPSVSDNTTTPEKPSVSDNTATPEKPSVSDNTTTPEKPSVSDNSTTPEKPSVSDNTATPEKPSVSDNTTTPEKPSESDNTTTSGSSEEYEYVDLGCDRDYLVWIWVKVKGYSGTADTNWGVFTNKSNPIKIKAKQSLPKVTTDKSTLNVYLFAKDYDASFIVKPKDDAAGRIQEVYFADGDRKPRESFELVSVPQADGSLKVIVHVKEAVDYANDTYNDVKLYVKYKGQGIGTSRTATSFTMKIHVN